VSRTIVIIHQPVPENATPDDLDVLDQASAVSDALKTLGYSPVIMPFELDVAAFAAHLEQLRPVCVFNLVECLHGDGRLIHFACSVLDHLGMPYTGAGTEAMFVTSNKVLAKRWMHLAGLPTAEWVIPGRKPEIRPPFPSRYIIKTMWEEASIGIDHESIQEASSMDELLDLMEKRSCTLNKKCFAERFIDGREFNIALLANKGGVQVLPIAEITFDFPDDRPKIVDYRAKWIEDSIEYEGTTRIYDFPAEDEPLLKRLKLLVQKCWKSFDLRGYARVDLRVDEARNPWILEINTNPCISPDGGFSAASARLGISYTDIIERILADTLDARR
jgi:D-alanine-D-alanine ligase